MQTYTLSGIQSMLGLSRAVITGLIAEGFVTPGRGPRREYLFSFQDVVLLRTAHGLQAANIPPRKILRSLQRLKASLPDELPMTGLRIAAVGGEVAVRDGAAQWHVDSGQLLIDFELRPAGGSVRLLGPGGPPAAPAATAGEAEAGGDGPAARAAFERGVALEAARQLKPAEQAYREAIRLAPAALDPYLNLSVLLCEAGRFADAVALGREALQQRPDEALLHFNLAVALEDAGRTDEALAHYDACLELEPGMADAHFNAARLHQHAGQAAKAIRHYSEYRRLQS